MTAVIAKCFLKFYIAQAVAGATVGFSVPFLKLFGAF